MADQKTEAEHGHGSVRVYLWVFLALIIGTIITVAAWKVHLPTVFLTILVALVIASVKASLVAAWFMHLSSERKAIYTILAFTSLFFLVMLLLSAFSMGDIPRAELP